MADADSSSPSETSAAVRTPLTAAAAAKFMIAAAACGEAVLFAFSATGQLPLAIAVGLHVAIVASLVVALWRPLRTGSDGGFAVMGIVGTLATGPFGALCALLLPRLSASRADTSVRLQAWYDRIALSSEQDGFTRMSDRIAIGRAANLAAPTPLELMREFHSGSTAIQQAALGVIARNFHPDYLAVLKLALDSPEPVVRVQAAAVAARVREILKRQIAPTIARAADPSLTADAALKLATELEATAASGLLEQAARSDAVRACTGLRARIFARLDVAKRSKLGAAPASTTEVVADEYLAHLLANGRFEEFRATRAQLLLPMAGRYRRRRVVLAHRTGTVPRLRSDQGRQEATLASGAPG
jgi:hypothetical protein